MSAKAPKAQPKPSATTRLESLGQRLHKLLKNLPDHAAVTDTLDYLVGALYGTRRAVEVGFVDRRGPAHSTYRPFLTNYPLDIVADRDLNKLWLAGFYFNSGIQRIAATYDRIPNLLGASGRYPKDRMKNANNGTPYAWNVVYMEVNFFKHAPEGRAKGRTVTLDIALHAMEQAISLLEHKTPEISAKYSCNLS